MSQWSMVCGQWLVGGQWFCTTPIIDTAILSNKFNNNLDEAFLFCLWMTAVQTLL